MNHKFSYLIIILLAFYSNASFAQDGLPLVTDDECILQGDTFCVDITTLDFDSIISMQFTMSWDSSLFDYQNTILTDIPFPAQFGYGEVFTDNGLLTVSWNADQSVGTASAADGTSIFQVCFVAIATPDTCATLGFQSSPLNVEVIAEVNGNAIDIGLDPMLGNICVVEPLEVIDTLMEAASCGGAPTGSIDITMNGGLAPYNFSWESNGFMASTEDISDLSPGMYYLTVTDSSLPNHIMMDSFEVVSPAFATSIAGPDTSITCTNSVITLNGTSNPPIDNDIFVEWYTPDGSFGSDEYLPFVDVDAAGTYYFVVLNGISLCSDTSFLVVEWDTLAPIADAGIGGQLTCSQTSLNLDGGNSIGDNLLYLWSTSGMGNIVSGDSTQTPLIDAPGIYSLVVMDTLNGCTSFADNVVVTQDAALPTAIAGTDTLITCAFDTINLDGTGSSTVAVTYQWSTIDGSIVAGANTLFPSVDASGTYQLVVTNTANCSDTSYVFVDEDMNPPLADAGADQTMQCGQLILLLDGSGSDQGADYSYLWTTVDGVLADGTTSLTPEAGGGGTYTLEVTDAANGCTALSTVMVIMDTIPPEVIIAPAAILTCDLTTTTLDATASSPGPQFTYEWNTVFGSILSDGDTPSPLIDSGGVYVLLMQNTDNNCIATGTVIVTMDTIPPLADAGPDTMILCGQPLALDASNSGQGAEVSYQWQSTDGNIVSGANELIPVVDAGGTYVMITTSSTNGCTDTDTVVVDGGVQLVDAEVGMDYASCEDSTLLMGNQPAGTTGLWTTNGTADILMADAMDTWVQNMNAGTQTFVWTLSTDMCPDYSTDTLLVQVEGTPIANTDAYTFFADLPVQELLLTLNDSLSTLISWEVSLINEPTEVVITGTNPGVYEVTNPSGFIGQLEFEYALCSETCPDLCDTTQVLLTIEEPIDTITQIANAITPNDDGKNDVFIIPEISMEPDAYPNSELIIYNRWGDIVFQAKPYRNDWRGTDKSGNELPQGTYYYLMRLDVTEGLIYQGDITILK